jgi:hypothetical protein
MNGNGLQADCRPFGSSPETLVLYRTRAAGLLNQGATHYGARPIQRFEGSRAVGRHLCKFNGHQPTIAEVLDLRGQTLTYSESPKNYYRFTTVRVEASLNERYWDVTPTILFRYPQIPATPRLSLTYPCNPAHDCNYLQIDGQHRIGSLPRFGRICLCTLPGTSFLFPFLKVRFRKETPNVLIRCLPGLTPAAWVD